MARDIQNLQFWLGFRIARMRGPAAKAATGDIHISHGSTDRRDVDRAPEQRDPVRADHERPRLGPIHPGIAERDGASVDVDFEIGGCVGTHQRPPGSKQAAPPRQAQCPHDRVRYGFGSRRGGVATQGGTDCIGRAGRIAHEHSCAGQTPPCLPQIARCQNFLKQTSSTTIVGTQAGCSQGLRDP